MLYHDNDDYNHDYRDNLLDDINSFYCKVLIDWVLYNSFFIIIISPIKFFKTFFNAKRFDN